MTRDDVLAELERLATLWDKEQATMKAEKLLLDYINDEDITEAFQEVVGFV